MWENISFDRDIFFKDKLFHRPRAYRWSRYFIITVLSEFFVLGYLGSRASSQIVHTSRCANVTLGFFDQYEMTLFILLIGLPALANGIIVSVYNHRFGDDPNLIQIRRRWASPPMLLWYFVRAIAISLVVIALFELAWLMC